MNNETTPAAGTCTREPLCSDWIRYLSETGHGQQYDMHCECSFCQSVRREYPRWLSEHPNSVLCVNDRMTACEKCGEEWPAGDHERWRLVNGQQVCAKCAKEAEPKREADAPPAKPRDSTGRDASAVAAMLPPKPRRMKANPKHSCEGNPYHGTEHDELASCVTIYLCEPVDAPLAANNNIMLRSERSERR